MSDTAKPKDAAEPNDHVERYRFKVRRKSDGTEIEAPIISIPKNYGRLGAPHFSGDAPAHGEWTWMQVQAQGLEGRKVKFKVEFQDEDGKWKAFEEAIGVVEHGEARAQVRLVHPEHRDGSIAADTETQAPKKNVHFRFHADLI